MGLLLGRGIAADIELPREIRDAAVGEAEAASSGQRWVFFCPHCHRRLCDLTRPSRSTESSPQVWRAPSSRLEKGWLSGATALRCHMCSSGRVNVDVLSQPDVGLDDSPLGQPGQHVAVGLPKRRAFRPFGVCVCAVYESVGTRAMALLDAEDVRKGRALHVSRCTLRRSELARVPVGALPRLPLELLIVAHRISGQRNPLTDAHGLYSALLEHAWTRADVVLLCLFDVPRGEYLSRLLEEQPTLLGLLRAGRLLPFFAADDRTLESDDAQQEADGGDEAPRDPEAVRWLVRCLDGAVPHVDALAALPKASAAADAQARAVAADAASAAAVGSSASVLKSVARSFQGWPLICD
mmetsp:Transcript_35307/g.77149  ORF Transcript_35307/g.77149 Transcript_35307/m.77149 type:complete len:353 (-) Transcript_35307:183-1241(-)